MEGKYKLYIQNFYENDPGTSVIIEDSKGNEWFGSYIVNKEGRAESIIPDDYMECAGGLLLKVMEDYHEII